MIEKTSIDKALLTSLNKRQDVTMTLDIPSKLGAEHQKSYQEGGEVGGRSKKYLYVIRARKKSYEKKNSQAKKP